MSKLRNLLKPKLARAKPQLDNQTKSSAEAGPGQVDRQAGVPESATSTSVSTSVSTAPSAGASVMDPSIGAEAASDGSTSVAAPDRPARTRRRPQHPPPSQPQRQYTMREIVIAVGLASGATKDETAEAIGISPRGLYYDMAKGGVIQELLDAVQPLIKFNRREIKKIAVDKAEAEMEKLLGAAMGAISDSLTGGADPKTAAENGWKVYHQLKGTPASTVKVQAGGTVTHKHEHYVLPAATLHALAADVQADVELMQAAKRLSTGSGMAGGSGAPGGVIDVTPS